MPRQIENGHLRFKTTIHLQDFQGNEVIALRDLLERGEAPVRLEGAYRDRVKISESVISEDEDVGTLRSESNQGQGSGESEVAGGHDAQRPSLCRKGRSSAFLEGTAIVPILENKLRADLKHHPEMT